VVGDGVGSVFGRVPCGRAAELTADCELPAAARGRSTPGTVCGSSCWA